MKTVEIEIPDDKKVEIVNGVLTIVDDKPKDVRDRIKTFEDAYQELGKRHPYCKAYDRYEAIDADCEGDDMVRFYLELRIICAALNEGWEPTMEVDVECYSLEFVPYKEAPYKELPSNLKSKCRRCEDQNGNTIYVAMFACDLGLGYPYELLYKSERLAQYAGYRFFDLYLAFYTNEYIFRKDEDV